MDFKLPRENQIDETEEFKVFSEEIEYLTEFFDSLSWLIIYNGHTISFHTDKESHTLDTTLIDSSVQTLKSIKLCCSIGSFSDANTLIRKLRDDLVQFVYILNIINLRKPFLEENIKEIKTNNPEAFARAILNLQFNNTFTDDEQAVLAWFRNSVSDLPRPIKRKLEYENYMTVLKQNDSINQILSAYKLHDYWDTLRKRLNDYVHNNGVYLSKHNIISAKDKQLETHLKNIIIRTSYISSFFLVLLLMIHSSLVSSTDYIDHMDCNIKPPEDSQYCIANFIQDYIDKKVTKIHPELKQYLTDNNIHGMKID